MHLAEHRAVLVIVEVAVGGEPTDDGVESVIPRQASHVALDVVDVVDLDAHLGGCGSGEAQEHGSDIRASDLCTACSERVRDAVVATRQVEYRRSLFESRRVQMSVVSLCIRELPHAKGPSECGRLRSPTRREVFR